MTDQLDVAVAVEPSFVDKDTAAKMLGGISVDKLEELMRSGEITAKTVGKRVVLEPDEIRRFARECPSWEPRRAS